ncbi:unnamed protein product [Ilex paraguariensis]|uniref:Uncharacterized protein n=1 Tax=Ilex paraguariensis TaxID=185542 RepID=A0ABC8V300_9AQUA
MGDWGKLGVHVKGPLGSAIEIGLALMTILIGFHVSLDLWATSDCRSRLLEHYRNYRCGVPMEEHASDEEAQEEDLHLALVAKLYPDLDFDLFVPIFPDPEEKKEAVKAPAKGNSESPVRGNPKTPANSTEHTSEH